MSVRKDEEILWILNINCCPERCMNKLPIDDIRYAEVHLSERNQTGRKNCLIEFLHDHTRINDSGEYETEFFVRGERVCCESWLLAH